MNKWVSEWLNSLKWHGLKECKNLYLLPEGKDEAALRFCWVMERQHSPHARHSRETREQVSEEVAPMTIQAPEGNWQECHCTTPPPEGGLYLWGKMPAIPHVGQVEKTCLPQLVSFQGVKIPRINIDTVCIDTDFASLYWVLYAAT